MGLGRGLRLARTRITLQTETFNLCFITSPELAMVVPTGDAQFVFVIKENTVLISIRRLLHASFDDFHPSVSVVYGLIPELTIVVVTRGPQTAILLQRQAGIVVCGHGLHAVFDDLHKSMS